MFIPQPVGMDASYAYFDVVDDGHVISSDKGYYTVGKGYEYRDGRWVSSDEGGRLSFSDAENLSWGTGRKKVSAVRFEDYEGRWRLRNLGRAPVGKYAFTFTQHAGGGLGDFVVVVYMGLGISEW